MTEPTKLSLSRRAAAWHNAALRRLDVAIHLDEVANGARRRGQLARAHSLDTRADSLGTDYVRRCAVSTRYARLASGAGAMRAVCKARAAAWHTAAYRRLEAAERLLALEAHCGASDELADAMASLGYWDAEGLAEHYEERAAIAARYARLASR